jgi:hypothetical protein
VSAISIKRRIASDREGVSLCCFGSCPVGGRPRFHDSNTLSALDDVPQVTGRSITIATLDAGYGVARVFAELEARRIEAIVPTRREPSAKKRPSVGSSWMRDTIVSAAREVGILCRTANQMPRASKSMLKHSRLPRMSAASGLLQPERSASDGPLE